MQLHLTFFTLAHKLTNQYNILQMNELEDASLTMATNGRSNGSNGLILIVDDVPDTLQLLQNWLEVHNYETISANSGTEALDKAAAHRPDLILMDVMMPKMDGIETCRRLKANSVTSNIPVILVTAKDPSDARAEGMMAGAVDYITKPINMTDLTHRVESAMAVERGAPIDVQRLLEEITYSALAILVTQMIWLLAPDNERGTLKSRMLATSMGSKAEMNFLSIAGDNNPVPEFAFEDQENPLCNSLLTRKMVTNLPIESLKQSPSSQRIFKAVNSLRLGYLTILPLIAAGKTSGIMVLGSYQPHNMESPRARQILSSLASQAAIVLDYSRLIGNLSEREREMQREQDFSEMILDTMSDGLAVIDSNGIIQYVNRRIVNLTNYPFGYWEGKSAGELFHPEDRAEVMRGLMSEKGATMKFEQRLVTQDGKIIPVLLTRSRGQTTILNAQVVVLSDMTEQRRREDALERHTQRLQALNKAAQAISSDLSLHQTLQHILQSAVSVVQAQGASLFLVNREKPDELIVVAAVGMGSEVLEGLRVPIGEGVAGWVAREAQSQLVTDIQSDPRFYDQIDQKTGMDTQSLVAVPLITANRVIGVLEAVNRNEGPFDNDDVRMLESMAGTAAVSIENARLFDQAQRRVTELATLLEASAAVSSTLNFASVLEHIARNLAAGLHVERCLIMSWDEQHKRLESLAEVCDALWNEENSPAHSLEQEPLTRAALSSGLPIVTSLLNPDTSAENRAELEKSGMVHMLIAPLWLNGSVVGLAKLYSADDSGQYTDEDADAVHQTVEKWHRETRVVSIGPIDSNALTRLARQLSSIQKTHWVKIQTWQSDSQYTYLVREIGFAEWTERHGAALNVDQYPVIRSVIHNGQVQTLLTSNLDPEVSEGKWLMEKGGQSCLIVPLVAHGAVIGLVKLVDTEERLFDTEEISLAQGIANAVSNAMENARLYQSLEGRAKALESAYSELQEADQAKDQFIQNVSHELRTPLMHVLSYAELMNYEQFGGLNDEQHEALKIIIDKAKKLTELVDDIISLKGLETQSFNRQETDLSQLIQDVIAEFRQKADDNGLSLISRMPTDLPSVYADPDMIIQAFKQLLDNALKFGATGERIEVMIRNMDGPMLQVAVKDYGIGIDPSEQEKIFHRFYQVDGGAARRYAGVGLGLALAKSIIERHGGRIAVKSEINEGSIFFFTLPKYNFVQE
jgi:PAS domain S-box-containing protein